MIGDLVRLEDHSLLVDDARGGWRSGDKRLDVCGIEERGGGPKMATGEYKHSFGGM